MNKSYSPSFSEKEEFKNLNLLTKQILLIIQAMDGKKWNMNKKSNNRMD